MTMIIVLKLFQTPAIAIRRYPSKLHTFWALFHPFQHFLKQNSSNSPQGALAAMLESIHYWPEMRTSPFSGKFQFSDLKMGCTMCGRPNLNIAILRLSWYIKLRLSWYKFWCIMTILNSWLYSLLRCLTKTTSAD